VKKHVLIRASVDKSKTFVCQPLDRTFSHFYFQLQKNVFCDVARLACPDTPPRRLESSLPGGNVNVKTELPDKNTKIQ
jgi:hypothetical protein